jgi:hypothetical protein
MPWRTRSGVVLVWLGPREFPQLLLTPPPRSRPA